MVSCNSWHVVRAWHAGRTVVGPFENNTTAPGLCSHTHVTRTFRLHHLNCYACTHACTCAYIPWRNGSEVAHTNSSNASLGALLMLSYDAAAVVAGDSRRAVLWGRLHRDREVSRLASDAILIRSANLSGELPKPRAFGRTQVVSRQVPASYRNDGTADVTVPITTLRSILPSS